MNKYGEFANIVAIAGALASTAAAISLAFMKRAKWQPPTEAVSSGTSRLAMLMAMIGTALLYVFGAEIGKAWLAAITVGLFVGGLTSLVAAIFANTSYSFYYPLPPVEKNRTLGGSTLTSEALRIQAQQNLSVQQMFEDAQGAKDKVWTRGSQAKINIVSTLSFIFLIGCGTCSLAAAATLVAVHTTEYSFWERDKADEHGDFDIHSRKFGSLAECHAAEAAVTDSRFLIPGRGCRDQKPDRETLKKQCNDGSKAVCLMSKEE